MSAPINKNGIKPEINEFITFLADGTSEKPIPHSPADFYAIFLEVVGRNANIHEVTYYMHRRLGLRDVGEIDKGIGVKQREKEVVSEFILSCSRGMGEILPLSPMEFHTFFFMIVGRKETLTEMNYFLTRRLDGAFLVVEKERVEATEKRDTIKLQQTKKAEKPATCATDSNILVEAEVNEFITKAALGKAPKAPLMPVEHFRILFAELVGRKATLAETNRFLRVLVGVHHYDVFNGLSGMLRDVVVRLFGLMRMEEAKIRAVIGISTTHMRWITHKYFSVVRNIHNLSLFERRPSSAFTLSVAHTNKHTQNNNNSNSLEHTSTAAITATVRTDVLCGVYNRVKCLFTSVNGSNKNCTVFIKQLIKSGIYRWTVQINYGKTGESEIGIGVSSLFSFYSHDETSRDFIGKNDFLWGASSSLCFLCNAVGGLDANLYHGKGKQVNLKTTGTTAPENSFLSVELDMGMRTLCFFVDGKRVPLTVAGVSGVVYLGAAGSNRASITSLFFGRLARPTTQSSASQPGRQEGGGRVVTATATPGSSSSSGTVYRYE